jgi:hypothetical protein
MRPVKRPLRQRVVALAAAYAIALAGVIAGFGTAQAVADALNQPDSVLCHSGAPEQPAPASDESGKICIAACCDGCLPMTPALSPRAAAAAVPHALSQQPAPLAHFVLVGGNELIFHRSRGPPPML